MTTTLFAEATIHYPSGTFVQEGEPDPETGNYRQRAIPIVLQAGMIHENVPDDVAAEMISLGAAREPTDRELQLRDLANGAVLVMPGGGLADIDPDAGPAITGAGR
jgi:hypothetical protein